MKKILSSKAPRAFKLLNMASQLASREFIHSAKNKLSPMLDELSSLKDPKVAKMRLAQAKILAENLGQLKGAAMKAGQLLSLDAADFFPAEAIEILSKLQAKAEAVDFVEMEKVLCEDLGDRISEFKMLDPIAIASASIGQVHKAYVDGEAVAVKIQYPGVFASIDSDLAILRTLAGTLLGVSGRKVDLGPLFSEFKEVLKAEANYVSEKNSLLEYRKLLNESSKDEVEPGFFIVPHPIEHLCSQRVLCMSWEEGIGFNEWLKTSPSEMDRYKVGSQLLNLYCLEFFKWGFVQTDPNFANYLIRPDPLQVVLLDFGATLRYPEEFRKSYVEVIRCFSKGDREDVFRQAVEFGLLDKRENDRAKDLFWQLMQNALEPFGADKQPFAFTDPDYTARAREITLAFASSLKFSAPPRQIIFLHRKLGGLFALLKKLDIRLDLRPYWEKMLGTDSQKP